MGISHNISYLIFGIPLFVGVLLLSKPKDFFRNLGLSTSIRKAAVFSMLCTVPMFMGFFFLFTVNTELSLNEFLISGVAAAFFEELYFRGFLFGIVFRFTRLGFFLSIILGAVLFATIHLYQSQDLLTLLGVFLTTFIGAIIFAWVYVEWQFNIWVPIGLHFFMNLSWMLFSVSDNALGDIYANSFRIITIILIFVLTIAYKKRNKQPFYITKKNIWFQKPDKNQLIINEIKKK
jgi:membrane protease YdiL (CAAX protease family)